VWPGLASQVASWCRDCQHCQRAKTVAQPSSPPQAIANPVQRFSHLHVDLVGPLPQSSTGLTHLLTVVDRSTRWAEAIPLRSTSTDACVSALIEGWIARFGVPQRITSDRGPQFTSSLWSELIRRLGVKSQLTSPYHPQANGAVERFHRWLKDALRARLASSDWPAHLPWVLLGLQVAPREDSGVSAAELVYGCALSLPSQFLSGSELPRLPLSANSTPLFPAWQANITSPPLHQRGLGNSRRRPTLTLRRLRFRRHSPRPTAALIASSRRAGGTSSSRSAAGLRLSPWST
jgi:transposase InsO family protein